MSCVNGSCVFGTRTLTVKDNQFINLLPTNKPRAIILLALTRKFSLWLAVDANVLLVEVMLGQNCTHELINTSHWLTTLKHVTAWSGTLLGKHRPLSYRVMSVWLAFQTRCVCRSECHLLASGCQRS